MLTRRLFLTGGATLLAAPAIVRFESLMPVRALIIKPSLWWTPDIGGFMYSEDLANILRAACWGKAQE